MTADAGDGLDELEELLEGGFFLGLLEQLRRQFRNLQSEDVEDAVVAAAEKTVRRVQKSPVMDVRKYLAKVAYNECNKATRRPVPVDATAPTEQNVEESVLQDAAVALVKAEVRTWENAHIREVTLAYLEMYLSGEVLDTEEVAEIVTAVLGEQISSVSISQWKARGFRRLREFIESNEWFDRRPDRVEGGTG